jgi:hypothetical protein
MIPPERGHAAIVPAALTRARTFEDFAERMSAHLADVRVIGPHGAPRGFAMLKGAGAPLGNRCRAIADPG